MLLFPLIVLAVAAFHNSDDSDGSDEDRVAAAVNVSVGDSWE